MNRRIFSILFVQVRDQMRLLSPAHRRCIESFDAGGAPVPAFLPQSQVLSFFFKEISCMKGVLTILRCIEGFDASGAPMTSFLK